MLYLTETDPLDCFSVDQAVWTFGTALENALEEAGKNAKKDSARKRAQDKVFAQWLPGLQGSERKFRDPGGGSGAGDVVRRV